MKFNSEVSSAEWDATTATWVVKVDNLITRETRRRRCKILISAVGALSTPKQCDIPGAKDFKGKLFHSAQWDHSFDWKGKDVVVIGMFHFAVIKLQLT